MTIQNNKLKDNYKEEFYQRLIKFSLSVISFCNDLRKDHNFWSMADQLIRSATSIGANIIEAKSCGSKLDYIRYFQIALKSANETKYWLILIKESDLKFKVKAEKLLDEAEQIARIIGAGILTMKGKR